MTLIPPSPLNGAMDPYTRCLNICQCDGSEVVVVHTYSLTQTPSNLLCVNSAIFIYFFQLLPISFMLCCSHQATVFIAGDTSYICISQYI